MDNRKALEPGTVIEVYRAKDLVSDQQRGGAGRKLYCL